MLFRHVRLFSVCRTICQFSNHRNSIGKWICQLTVTSASFLAFPHIINLKLRERKYFFLSGLIGLWTTLPWSLFYFKAFIWLNTTKERRLTEQLQQKFAALIWYLHQRQKSCSNWNSLFRTTKFIIYCFFETTSFVILSILVIWSINKSKRQKIKMKRTKHD